VSFSIRRTRRSASLQLSRAPSSGGTRGALSNPIEFGELDSPKFLRSNWWNALSERVCLCIYSSGFETGRGLARNLSTSSL
jgi:hypothetical protein